MISSLAAEKVGTPLAPKNEIRAKSALAGEILGRGDFCMDGDAEVANRWFVGDLPTYVGG
jgi:hypothetical protein